MALPHAKKPHPESTGRRLRPGWIVGSFITVMPITLLALLIAAVGVSGIDGGQTAENWGAWLFGSVCAAFAVVLGPLTWVAKRRERLAQSQPGTVRSVWIGGLLLPLLVAAPFAFALAVDDREDRAHERLTKDRHDRVRSELSAFGQLIAPKDLRHQSSSVSQDPLQLVMRHCQRDTAWGRTVNIRLEEDEMKDLAHIHRSLIRDGWSVRASQAHDPLMTHATVVITAIKQDVHLNVRAHVLPADSFLNLTAIHGSCVETNSEALASDRAHGIPATPFEDFKPVGTRRTSVDWNLWRSSFSSEPLHKNPCGDTPIEHAAGRRPWKTEKVADPTAASINLLADMRDALEIEGWETDFRRQRMSVSNDADGFDRELRWLQAEKGEQAVSFELILFRRKGQSQSRVEVTSRQFYGPCVSNIGVALLVPRVGEWVEIVEPRAFTPLDQRE